MLEVAVLQDAPKGVVLAPRALRAGVCVALCVCRCVCVAVYVYVCVCVKLCVCTQLCGAAHEAYCSQSVCRRDRHRSGCVCHAVAISAHVLHPFEQAVAGVATGVLHRHLKARTCSGRQP